VPLPGDLAEHWYGLTQAGALTRTVADARLVYGVLGGAGTAPADTPPSRIGLSTVVPAPLGRMSKAGKAAVARAGSILEAADLGTLRAEPPYPRDLIAIFTKFWHAGVAQDAERLGLTPARLEPRTASIVAKGRKVISAGGPDRTVASSWREAVLSWMSAVGVDVVMMPATAGPPVKAGSLVAAGYLRTLLTAATRTPMTQAWNLSGLPVVVVPVPGGPKLVGVQLVGRPGAELQLLQVAAILERG
jgi:amidase